MPAPLPRLLNVFRLATALCMAALCAGCATGPRERDPDIRPLLPADALLLGEQHDAAAHHRIHAQVAAWLAQRGALAALALEMADQGRSTAALKTDTEEAAVRAALDWNDKAWPWAHYGPAVMVAVRAGVPVMGANLPRSAMRDAMRDPSLDGLLPPEALQAQQAAIRAGHCDLLPEAQIAPMTRIQIARDRAMAHTVRGAAKPGKVVLLLAGSGHVDRLLGVPRHLPVMFEVRSVRLLAGAETPAPAAFDAVWTTPPLPPRDHCAELRRQLGQ